MIEEYKIEKGIPIPPDPRLKTFCGALREMEVGDSVLRASIDRESTRTMVAKIQRETNFRFVIRKDGPGYRVWRTA